MIVISEELVLSASSSDEEEHPNSPLIGWHNLITVSNIIASSEEENYPVINLANPITSIISRWKAADDGAQTIDVEINSLLEIDYVAIARHNLGSTQRPITVFGSDGGGSPDWHEVVQESLLPSNDPATIFRFDPQSLTDLRFSIGEPSGGSGFDPAEIAVMYVGKLLPLERRIYVDHTPINYGRSDKVVNGETEAGDFLGQIVTSEMLETGVQLQNLTPNWYRSKLDPFIQSKKPFFFAWRPGDYPDEVGFAWMTNKPQPRNQRPNGMMMIDLQMRGIAP